MNQNRNSEYFTIFILLSNKDYEKAQQLIIDNYSHTDEEFWLKIKTVISKLFQNKEIHAINWLCLNLHIPKLKGLLLKYLLQHNCTKNVTQLLLGDIDFSFIDISCYRSIFSYGKYHLINKMINHSDFLYSDTVEVYTGFELSLISLCIEANTPYTDNIALRLIEKNHLNDDLYFIGDKALLSLNVNFIKLCKQKNINIGIKENSDFFYSKITNNDLKYLEFITFLFNYTDYDPSENLNEIITIYLDLEHTDNIYLPLLLGHPRIKVTLKNDNIDLFIKFYFIDKLKNF